MPGRKTLPLEIAGREVTITNPDKVFFPRLGVTKVDLVRYYMAVADASRIPVLLYNVTMYTSVTLGADAVEQLSAHPNIAGMKESGNDLLYISECVNRTPDDFTVLAGSAQRSRINYERMTPPKRNRSRRKRTWDSSLEQGYGAYCLFTDASLVGKKAKPGDYKVMGSGVVQPADNMLGVVSLFADEADGEELKAMIKIIDSLKMKLKVAK